MSWTSIGSLGTGTEINAGTSASTGLDSSATAGTVLVTVIAKDNAAAASASTNEVTSVTDAGGNTWIKCGEYTNAPANSSKAGACVAVFMSKLTTTLNGGAGQITANFAISIGSVAFSTWQFTIDSGSTLSVAGGKGALGTSFGPLTISSLAAGEYLFFRGNALETETFNFTNTLNYTALNTNFADAGGTLSSMSVSGEFRILTGTGDISDPVEGSASDAASIFVAIKEVPSAAAATNTQFNLAQTGVGY